MRATLTEAFHMLLQLPVWVSLALAWAALHAWRAPKGTRWHRWRFGWTALAALFYVLNIPVVPTMIETRLERLHPVPRIAESDRDEGNVVLVLTGGWLRTEIQVHRAISVGGDAIARRAVGIAARINQTAALVVIHGE